MSLIRQRCALQRRLLQRLTRTCCGGASAPQPRHYRRRHSCRRSRRCAFDADVLRRSSSRWMPKRCLRCRASTLHRTSRRTWCRSGATARCRQRCHQRCGQKAALGSDAQVRRRIESRRRRSSSRHRRRHHLHRRRRRRSCRCCWKKTRVGVGQ